MPRPAHWDKQRRSSPQASAPVRKPDSTTKRFFKQLKDDARPKLGEWMETRKAGTQELAPLVDFAKNEFNQQVTVTIDDELEALREDIKAELALSVYRVIANFPGTTYDPATLTIQLPVKVAQLA